MWFPCEEFIVIKDIIWLLLRNIQLMDPKDLTREAYNFKLQFSDKYYLREYSYCSVFQQTGRYMSF